MQLTLPLVAARTGKAGPDLVEGLRREALPLELPAEPHTVNNR